LNTSI
jgi:hypothetical protein